MEHTSTTGKGFRKIGLFTIGAVYLLILVGGIVRSTGAGMGCPDWPKCFGQWVPPTNEAELPENYLEIYQEKRLAKNEKVAGYLSALGFEKAANQILTEKFIQDETPFNPVKTWIEYVNRLIGAVIGILILLTFYKSFPYLKIDKPVYFLSLFSVVLVIFQGWVGSVVVSTNLLDWMVSIHMLLALLLVSVMIYTLARSHKDFIFHLPEIKSSYPFYLLVAVLAFSIIQILLGTQVRESIDQLVMQWGFDNRGQWMENIDTVFYIHRSFSILVLGANLWLLYSLKTYIQQSGAYKTVALVLSAILGIEILSGVIMAYFEVPPVMQPIHLLLANLMFGVQFYLLIMVKAHSLFGKDIALSNSGELQKELV